MITHGQAHSHVGHVIAAFLKMLPVVGAECSRRRPIASTGSISFSRSVQMSLRTMKIVLLAAMFALATSLVGFAQGQPCPIPNQVFCQGWDGSDNLLASQNDTKRFGNFATSISSSTSHRLLMSRASTLWADISTQPSRARSRPGPLTCTTTMAAYRVICSRLVFFPETVTRRSSVLARRFPHLPVRTVFPSVDLAPGAYWASVAH